MIKFSRFDPLGDVCRRETFLSDMLQQFLVMFGHLPILWQFALNLKTHIKPMLKHWQKRVKVLHLAAENPPPDELKHIDVPMELPGFFDSEHKSIVIRVKSVNDANPLCAQLLLI